MDIEDLKALKLIAENNSISRAAEAFNISQPAMSLKLKRIEEELGYKLFDRGPNRLEINSQGEIALKYTDQILEFYESMEGELERKSKEDKTLSIAFCDPGLRWFCLPDFPEKYPDLEIREDLYDGGGEEEMLKSHEFDIVISPEKIRKKGISSLSFLKDRVYLSVPELNKLAKKDEISMEEIPGQPLLFHELGGYFQKEIKRIIGEKDLPIELVSNDYFVIQKMVKDTNFITTISTLSMDLRDDGENRKLIPFKDEELNICYHINFLKEKRDKARPFLIWAKGVMDRDK